MSAVESHCQSSVDKLGLRVERLPFTNLPGQSKLFLEYLDDPTALKKYYPSAVRRHHELTARAGLVLREHKTDRTELCDALQRMNIQWGASAETLQNIERLRDSSCVAVVSGQQVGLFTGPLYTIYKALSAVKLAACMSERGVEAVPVFWMATEDHDFAEVQATDFIGCDGRLARVKVKDELHSEGAPVGTVKLDDSIDEVIARLIEVLPTTEFSPTLADMLRESYEAGRGYGEAFAQLLTKLIGKYGLILLDPLDADLKRLAAPIYAEAARCAPEIAQSLVGRSEELNADGYHAQVLVTPDSFPLFCSRDSVRRAITRTGENEYQAKGSNQKWTRQELARAAANEPQHFSPNVTLRSVVQDYLLPTIAYYGGAAEIAYFAQTAEVYRLLQRPVTPILHRASLTIIERRSARTLERFDLKLKDFFDGADSVMRRVVETHLGAATAQEFGRSEEQIAAAMENLATVLDGFDPTLTNALTNAHKKIVYQMEALRGRFYRAQLARDRAANRQLERAFAVLYPEKGLQERSLNVASLVARHGAYAIDWLYDAINLSTNDHQVVYL